MAQRNDGGRQRRVLHPEGSPATEVAGYPHESRRRGLGVLGPFPQSRLRIEIPTVRDALSEAKALLRAARGKHPADGADRDTTLREESLEAEVLLAHVLGTGRAGLFANLEQSIAEPELRRFVELLGRRLRGEPVAYIVGHREFYGRDFLVDRRVLVPRPETEILVEEGIAAARRLARPDVRLVDVGTGSGCIAVSIAKELPAAKVYAVDVSAAALAVAAANCRRRGVASRVTLLQGDLLSALPEAVDVIAANLPYVRAEDFAGLQREIREHEPTLALVADEGGLALYRRLLAQAGAYLRPGGVILMELAPGQAPGLVAMVQDSLSGSTVAVRKDYAGLDRVVMVRT